VETIKFIFWEAMEVLGLAFLCLLAAKAVARLPATRGARVPGWLRGAQGALYALIAGLAILGARTVGYDVAAQTYLSASQDNLAHGQYDKAYGNARRAVELRPGSLRYWRTLAVAKIALRQFGSLLDDLPVFRSLSGGELDEEDAYRFAICYLYLADYDNTLLLTKKLIGENRFYAPPYVLQGAAYTAHRKYRDAELSFLGVLQMFPTHQAAAEGLAHAYFLEGNRAAALHVLEQTAQHPFPPEARRRFDALKALYAQ
jgi:tetratricopeptide (TPR) repeat protein